MRPTRAVRVGVMSRDGEQCVACADRIGPLEFQHRQAVGMGGSPRLPGYVDGLAVCPEHNSRFEGDLQLAALVYGWKVQRWVGDAGRVPVLYWETRQWCVLLSDGEREYVTAKQALALMGAVYGDETYVEWCEVLRGGSPDFDGKRTCEWLAVK
jgi:hypothetical protein